MQKLSSKNDNFVKLFTTAKIMQHNLQIFRKFQNDNVVHIFYTIFEFVCKNWTRICIQKWQVVNNADWPNSSSTWWEKRAPVLQSCRKSVGSPWWFEVYCDENENEGPLCFFSIESFKGFLSLSFCDWLTVQRGKVCQGFVAVDTINTNRLQRNVHLSALCMYEMNHKIPAYLYCLQVSYLFDTKEAHIHKCISAALLLTLISCAKLGLC